MKRALITGGLGQDGSFLSEYLLGLGYEVFATIRMHYPEHHAHHVKGVNYVYGDLTDTLSLESVIRKAMPHEIYNLAGQTFVPTSWRYPVETLDVNTSGLASILNIVESVCPEAKVYQASTSEMFGNAMQGKLGVIALDENSTMHPVSPYAVSKYASHALVDVYRQRDMYVVSGILFNHESERRGPEMVTRKITRHIAKWKSGVNDILELGAVNSKRDWGYAKDYVEAMHAMLQQKTPSDYVIGTGVAHSVYDFLTVAISEAGLEPTKYGKLVRFNTASLTRRPELLTLVADNTKASRVLGWQPKHSFKQLIKIMVDYDYNVQVKEEVCIPK